MAKLDTDQQTALETLTDASIRCAVMTGGPGVGKTFTLNAVVQGLAGQRVALCAPTGKAAKRLAEATGREASTIHSLLRGAPGMGFEFNAGNPLQFDVVICDEASMVDSMLMAALVEALGGARLLLVGDANQLPPVGAGQPLTDIIRSGKVPVCELTQIHRQAGDSWVIDNAYRIIRGERPSVEDTHDFTMVECRGSEAMIRAAVEAAKADPEAVILAPQKARGAGVVALNNAIQIALRGDVTLGERTCKLGDHQGREGDKVMITKNTRTKNVEGDEVYLANGSVGTLVSVLGDFRAIIEFDDCGEVELGGENLKATLAYALTVHKSQGSGWDHVVVIADPEHAFMLEQQGRQLIYTAVTRVQKRLTVIGCPETFASVAKGKMSNNRETVLAGL